MSLYDYHLADVHQGERADHSKVWVATCKCGFIGELRSTKAAAEDDALAHDTTENPT